MDSLVSLLILCILAFGFGTSRCSIAGLNVADFGAEGDGHTDDSKAFLKAWETLCGVDAEGNVTLPPLQVPEGKTYLLQPIEFKGPCNSSKVHIQVLGTLIPPGPPKAWKGIPSNSRSWISFTNVENLIIDGSGTINGYGDLWWKDENEKSSVLERPTALHFEQCNGLQLSGLHHVDSPRNHITIHDCKNVQISYLTITAPEDSPNTDGILIGQSSQINIHDSVIGTGDDCIAIINGSSYLNIFNINCGPGHGISVGSLGRGGGYQTVEEVLVRNCEFHGTVNGARIKTWQGGKGFARSITYENIAIIGSKNPIIIDQNYRDHVLDAKSAVAVSNVTYRGFHGISADEVAISFNCSDVMPCVDIVAHDINITWSGETGEQASAYCHSANGTCASSNIVLPCLSGEEC